MAQGVTGKLRLRIFLTFSTYEGGRSSALGTGRLYPRRNPWYSLLGAESTPGHMVPSVAMGKIPSDTTGNRTRDRPTSSVVLCSNNGPLLLVKNLLQTSDVNLLIPCVSFIADLNTGAVTGLAGGCRLPVR